MLYNVKDYASRRAYAAQLLASAGQWRRTAAHQRRSGQQGTACAAYARGSLANARAARLGVASGTPLGWGSVALPWGSMALPSAWGWPPLP